MRQQLVAEATRAPAPAPALDPPVRPPAGAPHGAAAKPGGAPPDGAAGWAWDAPGDGWRAQQPWALSLPDPASPAGLAQPPAAPALSPWPGGGAAPGPERWPADPSPHSDASDAASLSLVRRRAGPGAVAVVRGRGGRRRTARAQAALGLFSSASQQPGTPGERRSDAGDAGAEAGTRAGWAAPWAAGTPASLLSSSTSTEDAAGRPFSPGPGARPRAGRVADAQTSAARSRASDRLIV